MTGKVFLNYRRADAEAWADRLFERLIQQFPRENVFMDIDGRIPFGFPWADWFDGQVAACDLMLVLIGRSWVAEFKARSEAGERDYVRVEIESALKRKIPVVPVFLGDTPVPKALELPETMRPLLDLQAARLQRTSFDSDAEALAKGIARSIALARGEAVAGSTPRRSSPNEAALYQAEGRIKVDAKIVHGAPDGWFKPGAGKSDGLKTSTRAGDGSCAGRRVLDGLERPRRREAAAQGDDQSAVRGRQFRCHICRMGRGRPAASRQLWRWGR